MNRPTHDMQRKPGETSAEYWKRKYDEHLKANDHVIQERIVAYLRRPNDDGTDCSADREILAQRIERLEYLK